ncbi:hypothetical protein CRG98_018345 [Punica granatum]|uniref:Orn/Lys/Arg decarboxylase C-terminal domain-containing protein n=1 Tax=Punica granatum TaxID=22663 RepID=A0A2I0JY97_PUNGR|nr:hypothetical protein CRG98_018345 [Punica granatum]
MGPCTIQHEAVVCKVAASPAVAPTSSSISSTNASAIHSKAFQHGWVGVFFPWFSFYTVASYRSKRGGTDRGKSKAATIPVLPFRALSLRPLPLNLRVFDEIFYPPASPSFDPRSTCFFRQASSFEFPSTFSKWQTGGYILGYFELRLGAGQRLVFGIKQLSVGSSIGKINDKGSYNDCYEPFAEANARMSPRETFFAWKRRVSIAECIGRISGELICPYPPRIPVTIPREIIIERGLNYLVKAKMNGAAINGAFDSELSSIVVESYDSRFYDPRLILVRIAILTTLI